AGGALPGGRHGRGGAVLAVAGASPRAGRGAGRAVLPPPGALPGRPGRADRLADLRPPPRPARLGRLPLRTGVARPGALPRVRRRRTPGPGGLRRLRGRLTPAPTQGDRSVRVTRSAAAPARPEAMNPRCSRPGDAPAQGRSPAFLNPFSGGATWDGRCWRFWSSVCSPAWSPPTTPRRG